MEHFNVGEDIILTKRSKIVLARSVPVSVSHTLMSTYIGYGWATRIRCLLSFENINLQI